jgi:hypothetical protein
MSKPVPGRQMAQIDGDFVVFIIGTRPELKHPVRWFRDVGGLRGMQHMLKYLSKHPEKGLLHYENYGLLIIQYWRSFDHLEAFAREETDPHRPAWRRYWKRVGRQNRSGIWHETYLVRAGEYEAVYANMPPVGLARAGRLVPAAEASRARSRLGSRAAEPAA